MADVTQDEIEAQRLAKRIQAHMSDAALHGEGHVFDLMPDEQPVVIAALRRPGETWQTIESAPKDGSFLVYAPCDVDGRKPYSAGNSNYSTMFRSKNMTLVDCHFHYDMAAPTHWRSLPSPPKDIN